MSNYQGNKKACVTCGKLYKICMSCERARDEGYNFWRATACSPECYQVHLILHGYYYNEFTKEEARELLNQFLTEDMKPYSENARNLIEQIYQEDAAEPTPEEVIEEERAEEELIQGPQNPEQELEIEQKQEVIEEVEEGIQEEPVLFEPVISEEDIDEDDVFEDEI